MVRLHRACLFGWFRVFLAASVGLALPSAARADPEKDRNLAHDLYEAGRNYYQSKQLEKALRAFEQSYDLAPAPLLLFHLGRTAHAMGSYAEAREYLTRYLAVEPTGLASEEAHTLLDSATRMLADEAARAAEAHRRRAEDLCAAESFVAASQEYLAAFHASKDPEILFYAATAEWHGGALDIAARLYKLYVAVAPGGRNADTARRRIVLLADVKRLSDTYDLAARHRQRAVALMQAEMFGAAADEYRAAYAAGDDPEMLFAAAEALERAGMAREAAAAYALYLEAAPHGARARQAHDRVRAFDQARR